MKGRRRLIRWGLAVMGLLLLLGALSWSYVYFDVSHWQDLNESRLTTLAQKGMILDKDGQFVTTLVGRENRTIVPLDSLPQHVVDAFLAAEDLRFYKHPGFDVTRILGAVVSNIRTGDFGQGASTITQQLVKLSHLSSQKTIARKLEEIYIAVQMEQRFTKDEILDLYLNYIYFGQGAYGIQAAAEVTFGVDAAALSPAQAAALAAAIKAPSAYSIQSAPDANRDRRTYILATMHQSGMLSDADFEAAVNEELTPLSASAVQMTYGWFVDAVLDEAEDVLSISAETLLGGGYVITTTLDQQMQAVLEEQFTKDVFPANAKDGTPVQSAAACVDVANGAMRTLVGGREYLTRRGLNRATQLRRQPGSSIKPLAVYAPAMESGGWTAASLILDEPTNFGGYTPRNAGNAYHGNVTVRTALKSSLNIPACKIMKDIGVAASRKYLQSVGIELDDRDWNLSLALGSMTYGASPVQMAAAYAPFANGGTFHAPYCIEQIVGPSGEIIYQHAPDERRVLSAQTAYLMTSLLKTVITSGTGTRLASVGTPVAGKTGTVNMTGTSGNRDAWMAAYTPSLSIAVWMGFDEPDASHKLSSAVSGGTNPASLARNFLKAWYANRKKPDFAKPNGIVSATLDKKALEQGKLMLASNLTPDSYKLTEMFAAGTQPTQKSDVWQAPNTTKSFYVTHSDSGQPVLVIQTSSAGVYRVQRDAAGESFILTELRGSAGETLYFTDNKAKPGVVYTYRVIPVNAELLDNGILLEGIQSVAVAQVRQPEANLGGWLGTLLGGSAKEERPASIFSK